MRILVKGVVLLKGLLTQCSSLQVLNDDKQLHPRSKQ